MLISRCFNLVVADLFALKQMLAACERGDYGRAAEETLALKSPGQVDARAEKLAQMMPEGRSCPRFPSFVR